MRRLAGRLEPCRSITDMNSDWVLVNRRNPLSPRLRAVGPDGSTDVGCRRPAAARRCGQGARADGVGGRREPGGSASTRPTGRYATQDALYDKWLARRGRAWTDTWYARPGYSEHQTGLTVDLLPIGGSSCTINDCIDETPQGVWLATNAWRYGYILRYEKRLPLDVTGSASSRGTSATSARRWRRRTTTAAGTPTRSSSAAGRTHLLTCAAARRGPLSAYHRERDRPSDPAPAPHRRRPRGHRRASRWPRQPIVAAGGRPVPCSPRPPPWRCPPSPRPTLSRVSRGRPLRRRRRRVPQGVPHGHDRAGRLSWCPTGLAPPAYGAIRRGRRHRAAPCCSRAPDALPAVDRRRARPAQPRTRDRARRRHHRDRHRGRPRRDPLRPGRAAGRHHRPRPHLAGPRTGGRSASATKAWVVTSQRAPRMPSPAPPRPAPTAPPSSSLDGALARPPAGATPTCCATSASPR